MIRKMISTLKLTWKNNDQEFYDENDKIIIYLKNLDHLPVVLKGDKKRIIFEYDMKNSRFTRKQIETELKQFVKDTNKGE